MRKCQDCAEENMNQSLFCKQCGRCLLVPDPEEFGWSTAVHTEPYKSPEGIDFDGTQIVKNSRAALQRTSQQTAPAVFARWLLLLNVVAFFLMIEIVRYIFAK